MNQDPPSHPGSRLRRVAPGLAAVAPGSQLPHRAAWQLGRLVSAWRSAPAPAGTPRRRRASALGLAGLLILAGCGDQQSGGSSTPSSSGTTATVVACPSTPSKPAASNGLPDVTLPCLGEGPDTRLADLRGPLVVNLWAQWCGPCRDEAPYLAALQKKAAGKVKLIGIDYADPRPELAVKFAAQHGLDYPHLKDADKAVQQPLKVGGPPLTAFVDQDGAVVYVHRGVLKSQQQLDQLVKDKLGVTL